MTPASAPLSPLTVSDSTPPPSQSRPGRLRERPLRSPSNISPLLSRLNPPPSFPLPNPRLKTPKLEFHTRLNYRFMLRRTLLSFQNMMLFVRVILMSRFKASVTVDGQTFNSVQVFSSLKESENDAAKEALLLLSLDESQQDKSYLYKNMLQELAIKEDISLPKYKTTSNGANHMPIFSSTVEALLLSSLYESRQDKSYLYKNMLQELAIKEGISLPEYKTTSAMVQVTCQFSLPLLKSEEVVLWEMLQRTKRKQRLMLQRLPGLNLKKDPMAILGILAFLLFIQWMNILSLLLQGHTQRASATWSCQNLCQSHSRLSRRNTAGKIQRMDCQ